MRDAPELKFEQLIDLCGVDYSAYGGVWDGARYAVVYHLLSLTHNRRLRLRTFAADDDLPVVDSVIGVGPRRTGTSAKHSISTASFSPATRTCAAS